MDIFATVYNTQLHYYMSPFPEPPALAVVLCHDLSRDGPCTCFLLFPLLNKAIQKLRDTQEDEIILLAPSGRFNRGCSSTAPIPTMCGAPSNSTIPYRRDPLSQSGYISLKSYDE